MEKININNKMKDRLFRLIFHEKKDLLELYNAVADRDYHDPELLVITTLDDALYMGMKNDLSFLISDILNLYEHQGSFNPNMPIRGFNYLSDVYRQFIEEGQFNVYGSKLVKLPTPQYVVFYNGTQEEPDRMELKLSDAFLCQDPDVEPCLECRAVMLNVNYGHNKELMERCNRLKEYAVFIHRVRENQKGGLALEEAVDQAVKTCIREGILADILSKNRAEVRNLILYEYDEQKQLSLERRDGYIEGRIEGKAEGKAEGRIEGKAEGRIEGKAEGRIEGKAEIISVIRKKMDKGLEASAIAEILELEEEYVSKVLKFMEEEPDWPDLRIAQMLTEQDGDAS